jgi:hypothetical protein
MQIEIVVNADDMEREVIDLLLFIAGQVSTKTGDLPDLGQPDIPVSVIEAAAVPVLPLPEPVQAVTIDDVRGKALAILERDASKRAAVEEVVLSYGVKDLTEIGEGLYPELIAKLEAVA